MIVRSTPSYGTQKVKTKWCLWPLTVSSASGESKTYWLHKVKVFYVYEDTTMSSGRYVEGSWRQGKWRIASVQPL